MYFEFLDCFWLYFFYTCLIGFRLDTGRLPFTLIVKLIPNYLKEVYFYKDFEYDPARDRMNKVYICAIPFLLDIIYIKEL